MGHVVRLACLLRAKRWARRLRAAHQVELCSLKLEAFQRELTAGDVGMAEADRDMEVILRLARERGMPDDSSSSHPLSLTTSVTVAVLTRNLKSALTDKGPPSPFPQAHRRRPADQVKQEEPLECLHTWKPECWRQWGEWRLSRGR
jgi:hypothetical protein